MKIDRRKIIISQSKQCIWHAKKLIDLVKNVEMKAKNENENDKFYFESIFRHHKKQLNDVHINYNKRTKTKRQSTTQPTNQLFKLELV